MNKDDTEIYDEIVKWMKRHQDNFEESCYSNVISKAIKKSDKYVLYHIDNLIITKQELDRINSLCNLREEKMAFVLLCMAKQQAQSIGFTNGLVKYSLVDVCKMARIVVPADEREYILHGILQKGLISCPKKNDTECLIVNFMSDDTEVLCLNEMDCQELAYVYLNWKNGGGYDRCQKCGRLFRHHKNRKYCIECSKYQPIGDKIITCVDCGKEVIIDALNTKTCRCNECQENADKESTRERVRKYRENLICNGSL